MELAVEITDGSRGLGHRRVLQPHCIYGNQQTEHQRCRVKRDKSGSRYSLRV